LAIFISDTAVVELAGDGDGGVLRADQGEQVLARRELHLGQLAELAAETRGEFRVRIDPGADGRATLRQRLQARQQSCRWPMLALICCAQPSSTWLMRTGMASIRCVRPVLTW
jgi:hypothetical protein